MRMRRALLLVMLVAAAALAAGVLGTGRASAYGKDAQHQVTISSSITPNLFGPGTGGGIWLWIELDGTSATSGGTGDYSGADCIHHTPLGPTGAHPDSGEVTWSVSGTTITIEGVTIGGDNQPVTITVPLAGHERTDDASVFSLPVGGLPGRTEVTVTG
jgi:hypothetical protein